MAGFKYFARFSTSMAGRFIRTLRNGGIAVAVGVASVVLYYTLPEKPNAPNISDIVWNGVEGKQAEVEVLMHDLDHIFGLREGLRIKCDGYDDLYLVRFKSRRNKKLVRYFLNMGERGFIYPVRKDLYGKSAFLVVRDGFDFDDYRKKGVINDIMNGLHSLKPPHEQNLEKAVSRETPEQGDSKEYNRKKRLSLDLFKRSKRIDSTVDEISDILSRENVPIGVSDIEDEVLEANNFKRGVEIDYNGVPSFLVTLHPGDSVYDVSDKLRGDCIGIPLQCDRKRGHTLLFIEDKYIHGQNINEIIPFLKALNDVYPGNDFDSSAYDRSKELGAIYLAFNALKSNSIKEYEMVTCTEGFNRSSLAIKKLQELERRSGVPIEQFQIVVTSWRRIIEVEEEGKTFHGREFRYNIFDLRNGDIIYHDPFAHCINKEGKWYVEPNFFY